MEHTAQPGTVQIAEATYRLLAPLFDVEVIEGLALKGVAEPVWAYRVLGRRDRPGALRGIAGGRRATTKRRWPPVNARWKRPDRWNRSCPSTSSIR